jgi:hypothetical protein
MKLLTTNPKTEKGKKRGYSTQGIHFLPADLSGFNVCQWFTTACKFACLNTSGRGQMSSVQLARLNKTLFYFNEREAFNVQLKTEIEKAITKAKKNHLIPSFRLNLTSDIDWENEPIENGQTVFQLFPDIVFYDYTKGQKRMERFLDKRKEINSGGKYKAKEYFPSNYWLTFSRSETNDKQCRRILQLGGNVAAVFRNGLPERWNGYPVINGDVDDLRFLDRPQAIVGLIEKGKAKQDELGFVIDWNK